MRMKKLLTVWACALALAGCVSHGMSGDNLDEIATDYVQMQLEIGEREPGYIDAYYGPAEWQEAAKSAPRSLDQLAQEAADLTQRANAVDADAHDRSLGDDLLPIGAGDVAARGGGGCENNTN